MKRSYEELERDNTIQRMEIECLKDKLEAQESWIRILKMELKWVVNVDYEGLPPAMITNCNALKSSLRTPAK